MSRIFREQAKYLQAEREKEARNARQQHGREAKHYGSRPKRINPLNNHKAPKQNNESQYTETCHMPYSNTPSENPTDETLNAQLNPVLNPMPGTHTRSMFQRLDTLENEGGNMTYTGSARWMIPYADMLTVLLGLFLVMIAMAANDKASLSNYTAKIAETLHIKTSQVIQQDAELNQLRDELNNLKTISLAVATPMPTSQTPKAEPAEAAYTALAIEELDTDTQQALLKKDSDINILQTSRGLIIRMKDNVLFSSGSADLSDDAKATLDQLADVLKHIHRPISVEGHTDDSIIHTAQFPSNWELSTARATHIVRYFLESHGFNPTQLSAAGYGQYRPLTANSTIQGKQKNRRVDIVVLGYQAKEKEPIPYPKKESHTRQTEQQRQQQQSY